MQSEQSGFSQLLSNTKNPVVFCRGPINNNSDCLTFNFRKFKGIKSYMSGKQSESTERAFVKSRQRRGKNIPMYHAIFNRAHQKSQFSFQVLFQVLLFLSHSWLFLLESSSSHLAHPLLSHRSTGTAFLEQRDQDGGNSG